MTPKKKETIKEGAAHGEYTLVAPIDYMLLEFMPEEGQLVFGLYPLGETVLAIKKKFTPDQQKALTSEVVGSRMRLLRDQGLAVTTHAGVGASGKMVWQRTKTGTAVLTKWKGANGGGSSGGGHA